MIEELYGRMEVPNARNRWDSPLFVQQHKQPLPLEAIAKTLLFEGKRTKDPVSTQRERVFDESFLFELNSRLQLIIESILAKQQEAVQMGGVITIEG